MQISLGRTGFAVQHHAVENEVHFLLESSAYSRERRMVLFLKLNILSNKCSHKAQDAFQVYHLFNSKNVTAVKIFVEYIRSISEIRENLLWFVILAR